MDETVPAQFTAQVLCCFGGAQVVEDTQGLCDGVLVPGGQRLHSRVRVAPPGPFRSRTPPIARGHHPVRLSRAVGNLVGTAGPPQPVGHLSDMERVVRFDGKFKTPTSLIAGLIGITVKQEVLRTGGSDRDPVLWLAGTIRLAG